MKARIKATGEIVDGYVDFDCSFVEINNTSSARRFSYSDYELISLTEATSIDWEQREWEASVAIYCKRFEKQPNSRRNFDDAIRDAKSLIEEFKKQQKP